MFFKDLFASLQTTRFVKTLKVAQQLVIFGVSGIYLTLMSAMSYYFLAAPSKTLKLVVNEILITGICFSCLVIALGFAISAVLSIIISNTNSTKAKTTKESAVQTKKYSSRSQQKDHSEMPAVETKLAYQNS